MRRHDLTEKIIIFPKIPKNISKAEIFSKNSKTKKEEIFHTKNHLNLFKQI